MLSFSIGPSARRLLKPLIVINGDAGDRPKFSRNVSNALANLFLCVGFHRIGIFPFEFVWFEAAFDGGFYDVEIGREIEVARGEKTMMSNVSILFLNAILR